MGTMNHLDLIIQQNTKDEEEYQRIREEVNAHLQDWITWEEMSALAMQCWIDWEDLEEELANKIN